MTDAKWEKGKSMALKFYANKLRYKEKQFNRLFPLDDYFKPMIGDKREVSIADLGAGMFSTTGSSWPTAIVRMYPSDILSDDYNQLLKDKGVTPLIPVEKQDMTNLTYPNEFFDIVHCVNALDHCENPVSALKEMYRVCKYGGWIYLRHFLNNGEYHHYHGFHKWNLSKSNGDCFIWGEKVTDCCYFAEYFNGFSTYTQDIPISPGVIIVSTMRKRLGYD